MQKFPLMFFWRTEIDDITLPQFYCISEYWRYNPYHQLIDVIYIVYSINNIIYPYRQIGSLNKCLKIHAHIFKSFMFWNGALYNASPKFLSINKNLDFYFVAATQVHAFLANAIVCLWLFFYDRFTLLLFVCKLFSNYMSTLWFVNVSIKNCAIFYVLFSLPPFNMQKKCSLALE